MKFWAAIISAPSEICWCLWGNCNFPLFSLPHFISTPLPAAVCGLGVDIRPSSAGVQTHVVTAHAWDDVLTRATDSTTRLHQQGTRLRLTRTDRGQLYDFIHYIHLFYDLRSSRICHRSVCSVKVRSHCARQRAVRRVTRVNAYCMFMGQPITVS